MIYQTLFKTLVTDLQDGKRSLKMKTTVQHKILRRMIESYAGE